MTNPLHWPLTGLRWFRKMAAMLRELRTHEQQILSGRDLIAAELRNNGRVIDEMRENPVNWKLLKARVSTTYWERYSGQLSVLRKRHPELWAELVDAYEKLHFAAGGRSPGISSDVVNDLATRLGEAEIR
jgi:hypothetical protein